MNILSKLPIYAGKWSVKDSSAFSQEDINMVSQATVVDSQYGKSVCFFLKSGGQTYIPLSTTSSLGIGDTIDLTKAKLLTLGRAGEADIYRVDA